MGVGEEIGNVFDGVVILVDVLMVGFDDIIGVVGCVGVVGCQVGVDVVVGVEMVVIGWVVVSVMFVDYVVKVCDIGGDVGNVLVGVFILVENVIGDFVKIGKLNFCDFVILLIVDLVKFVVWCFIFGFIVNVLFGVFGGVGGIFVNVLYVGGMVGVSGLGCMVLIFVFVNVLCMYFGGWVGLRLDEVLVIL